RVNNTGKVVHEEINVGTQVIHIDFDTAANMMGFYGSVSLQIIDFVAISGSFGFEKSVSGATTKLLVGASNISVFLGTDYGTEDALGLQVTDGNLGLVLYKTGTAAATYALSVDGSAALVGLPGLQISGSLGVKINQTGHIVSEVVHTESGDVQISFTTAENIKVFSGSVMLMVEGIFSLGGTVTATIKANGTILLDIPDVQLTIFKDAEELFFIAAAARFSIAKGSGFSLVDMRVTGFRMMGIEGSPTPNYVGSALDIFTTVIPSATPAPGAAPDANLDFPLNGGQIDASVLNTKKYIDITFNDYTGSGLNLASITDMMAEFTISGEGVGDAVLSSVEQLTGTTYRYHFTDKDTTNTIGLFRAGIVRIQFLAGTFSDNTGQSNALETESFTVVMGSAATNQTIALGPVQLQGPSIGIQGFQFQMLK
ncbi:MAG: hypothetical protein AAGU05_12790, partial [Anaerolineaceae bacterium]